MTMDVDWRPLEGYAMLSEDAMAVRASSFLEVMRRRRSVRGFADRPVPRGVIADCLRVAMSAPSGANLQPWHFTVVEDPAAKRELRLAAEAEERAFYEGRAPAEWLEALAPLGTDADKSFLEPATLIAVFAQRFGALPDGRRVKHYYVAESVGIAVGFLIAALHQAGLATLTHTPSPMGFLNEICGRPENEKPYLLLACGFPAEGVKVPAAGGTRRPFEETVDFF